MFAPIDPYETGFLDRADGVRLYWEAAGNPAGRPALYLHGGPGGFGTIYGGYRRRFDPAGYRIVGFDQRGSGRSTPWACDTPESLSLNTAQAMVADIEALREYLGIDQWLVHGVSWGSTLALAYAISHPERCSAVLLYAVTTGARAEIDWITVGIGSVFPEAWHRFADHVGCTESGRPVEAYARLLRDPDPAVRTEAADEWDRWENTHISLGAAGWTGPYLHEDPRIRLNFATLVTHYWAHDCFLPGSQRILDNTDRLAGIPGALLHGRRDVSGPAITARQLHRRWPGSELFIEETEGHGGRLLSERAVDVTDRWLAVI
ncbi:MAG: alpha/beta fold hydrolase [Actinomycetota bacterium]|nr:alpha/beta fold hydrolase [Actinomycetota bacterium]